MRIVVACELGPRSKGLDRGAVLVGERGGPIVELRFTEGLQQSSSHRGGLLGSREDLFICLRLDSFFKSFEFLTVAP